ALMLSNEVRQFFCDQLAVLAPLLHLRISELNYSLSGFYLSHGLFLPLPFLRPSFPKFIGGHGLDRHIVQFSIDSDYKTPILSIAPRRRPAGSITGALVRRIGKHMFKVLRRQIMLSQMRDDYLGSHVSVERHGRT